MPVPDIQRDQGREVAMATASSLSALPPSGAMLGSFVALVDHLIAAQTSLISSYLRIGSSVVRRSPPATPIATIGHPHPENDQPAWTPAPSDPAPSPDAIAVRAYQIFVERGREPGDPVDDWRRAEAELHAETTG
jgi:hypothetical protein